MRVGTGYDSHRLEEGRPLVLGGVTVPFDRGPAGHSDGDAAIHAVVDALLGAAAVGDIGQHFPDDDPAYKDCDSMTLLVETVELLAGHAWRPVNVDCTVLLERPKLSDHIGQMRARIAGALGLEIGAVSVKAKTNEGLGEVGSGDAVVVHAVASIERA